jgi:hypothetical protein
VLKITITDLPDAQRWSLRGHLVDQWASELRSTGGKLDEGEGTELYPFRISRKDSS